MNFFIIYNFFEFIIFYIKNLIFSNYYYDLDLEIVVTYKNISEILLKGLLKNSFLVEKVEKNFFEILNFYDLSLLELNAVSESNLNSNFQKIYNTSECIEFLSGFKELNFLFKEHSYFNISNQFIHCVSLSIFENKLILYEDNKIFIQKLPELNRKIEILISLFENFFFFKTEYLELCKKNNLFSKFSISQDFIFFQSILSTKCINFFFENYNDLVYDLYFIELKFKYLLNNDFFFFKEFLLKHNSNFFIPCNLNLDNTYIIQIIKLFELYYSFNEDPEFLLLFNDYIFAPSSILFDNVKKSTIEKIEDGADSYYFLDDLKDMRFSNINENIEGNLKNYSVFERRLNLVDLSYSLQNEVNYFWKFILVIFYYIEYWSFRSIKIFKKLYSQKIQNIRNNNSYIYSNKNFYSTSDKIKQVYLKFLSKRTLLDMYKGKIKYNNLSSYSKAIKFNFLFFENLNYKSRKLNKKNFKSSINYSKNSHYYRGLLKTFYFNFLPTYSSFNQKFIHRKQKIIEKKITPFYLRAHRLNATQDFYNKLNNI